MAHWKDIVVKQHADIEQEIRISSMRYNLAKANVINGAYYTDIGATGVNHRFQSNIYDFSASKYTGKVSSTFDLTVTDVSTLTANKGLYMYINNGMMLVDANAGFTLDNSGSTCLIHSSENIDINTTGQPKSISISSYDTNNGKVAQLNLLSPHATLYSSNSIKLSIGGMSGDSGGASILLERTSASSDVGTSTQYSIELESTNSGIGIIANKTAYTRANTVSLSSTKGIYLVNDTTNSSSYVGGDSINIYNRCGDISLQARERLSTSGTNPISTVGGLLNLSKSGSVEIYTNTNKDNYIRLSNSSSAFGDSYSGIELHAQNRSIDLILNKSETGGESVKQYYASLNYKSSKYIFDVKVDKFNVNSKKIVISTDNWGTGNPSTSGAENGQIYFKVIS